MITNSQRLEIYQQNALDYVEQQAIAISRSVCIEALLAKAKLTKAIYGQAMLALGSQAQIALHFHPERLCRLGVSVAEGLLQSGRYKNQFETGISGGSPSAFAGGERDLWERRLFGGAYHGREVPPAGRPKYGALQVISHSDGPAPRFGSCYFLLHPQVCQRATFTFGGSQQPNALMRTGTLRILDLVMAQAFSELELGQGAFGVSDLNLVGFLQELTEGLFTTKASSPLLGRALDSFVEAQIHGDVLLDRDVAQLIVDPAFRDHRIGEVLQQISSRYAIPLSWHPGFTLQVELVPHSFRGYPIAPLARRAAGNSLLDAAKIGALANSLEQEPEAWEGWASYEDTLTQFRRLWHFLVLKGFPRGAS